MREIKLTLKDYIMAFLEAILFTVATMFAAIIAVALFAVMVFGLVCLGVWIFQLLP